MRKRKTLRDKILALAYNGILIAVTAGVGISWADNFHEESQRVARIEREKEQRKNQLEKRINQSNTIYVSEIEEAIERGLKPGKIVSFVDGKRRKRVTIYNGIDPNGNYEFEMLGDYKITAEDIKKQRYKLNNFHDKKSQ